MTRQSEWHVDKGASERAIANEALRFLEAHRLDPNPSNYAFAYVYLTNTTSAMHKAVNEITDGGFRLSQAEVDEILKLAPAKSASEGDEVADMSDQVRHQLLAVSDLTTASLRHTSDFGRDLTTEVEKAAAGADLVTLVRGMIERTAEVERKLAQTAAETEKLRHDLNAARHDATRDALTNLPNRRAIEGQLQLMLGDGQTLVIAYCDIDHFKSINDRFGHAVGDRVLKSVAEVLAQAVDPHTVARYGGEEFVILFSGLDGHSAVALVEKARTVLTERQLRVRETDELIGTITFSAGIAMTRSNAEDALREADALLYTAKNQGRNCTVHRITH